MEGAFLHDYFFSSSLWARVMNLRSSQRPSPVAYQCCEEAALELFHTLDGRGWGVRTKQHIPKRTTVVEYRGILLSEEQGVRNEQLYDSRGDAHCYMFWFRARGLQMCLDATASSHVSRYINHSRKRPNLMPRLKMKMVAGLERPHIIFKAKVDLEPGMELLFDYGDKRREVVAANPWLLE